MRCAWNKHCKDSGLISIIHAINSFQLNARGPLQLRSTPEVSQQQLISLKHTILIKQMSIKKERKRKETLPLFPCEEKFINI